MPLFQWCLDLSVPQFRVRQSHHTLIHPPSQEDQVATMIESGSEAARHYTDHHYPAQVHKLGFAVICVGFAIPGCLSAAPIHFATSLYKYYRDIHSPESTQAFVTCYFLYLTVFLSIIRFQAIATIFLATLRSWKGHFANTISHVVFTLSFIIMAIQFGTAVYAWVSYIILAATGPDSLACDCFTWGVVASVMLIIEGFGLFAFSFTAEDILETCVGEGTGNV